MPSRAATARAVRFLIARQHHDRLDALPMQQVDRVGGDLALLVGDADHADDPAVARDEHG